MNRSELVAMEKASIREFVSAQRHFLAGRVLDYGCGVSGRCSQPQPYRSIVESVHKEYGGGEYVPYDQGFKPPEGEFDAVLMTQVLQFIEEPAALMRHLAKRATFLVMTYPTNWYEVERDDWWRFTKRGVERLLTDAGFDVRVHAERWSLPFSDFRLIGGYGVVAQVR